MLSTVSGKLSGFLLAGHLSSGQIGACRTDVVGKDVKAALRHDLNQGQIATEIAREAFYQDGRILFLHQLNCLGKVVRSKILKIVPAQSNEHNERVGEKKEARKQIGRHTCLSTVVMTI